MWRLLRLTELHDERGPRNQNRVHLGRKFHADLLFWKWAINHKLLEVGEAFSLPCCTALTCPAKRHYFSDASFKEVGEYWVEKNVYWRYDLPPALTKLKRKAERRETCINTSNLRELLGMVMTS